MILNPLANFLWVGGLVFLAGGALALRPMKARQADPRREPQRAVGLLMAFSLLIGAGWTMWGLPHGTARRDTARPIPGSPAPAFELPRLDGSSFTLKTPPEGITVVSSGLPGAPPASKVCCHALRVGGLPRSRRHLRGIAYQSEETRCGQRWRIRNPLPVGLDREDALANRYGITGVPESFVIDTQGRVAFLHVGPVSAEQFVQELETLLEGETP